MSLESEENVGTTVTVTLPRAEWAKEAVAPAIADAARKAGVRVVEQYWTLGDYDGVLILESDKAEKALHCLAELTAKRNVTTHTLPAYTSDEIKSVMKK